MVESLINPDEVYKSSESRFMQSKNPNWWLIAHLPIKVGFNVSPSIFNSNPLEHHLLWWSGSKRFLLFQMGFAGGAHDSGKPIGYVSSNMLNTDPVTANVLIMRQWSALFPSMLPVLSAKVYLKYIYFLPCLFPYMCISAARHPALRSGISGHQRIFSLCIINRIFSEQFSRQIIECRLWK